jgi:hypothetical protein
MELFLKPKKTLRRKDSLFNKPPSFIDLFKLGITGAYINAGKSEWMPSKNEERSCMLGKAENNASPLKEIQLCLDGVTGCMAEYKTCTVNSGWESLWRSQPDGLDLNLKQSEDSGAIEAVVIQLNKGAESLLDITYRIYIQNEGWLDWVNGGEETGTAESGKPCTAVEVKINTQNKGEKTNVSE